MAQNNRVLFSLGFLLVYIYDGHLLIQGFSTLTSVTANIAQVEAPHPHFAKRLRCMRVPRNVLFISCRGPVAITVLYVIPTSTVLPYSDDQSTFIPVRSHGFPSLQLDMFACTP